MGLSLTGLIVAYFVIENPPMQEDAEGSQSVWRQIDLSGALLLVLGLSVQLAALSLGGNQYPWSDSRVIFCLVASVIILAIFVLVELRTRALPVMPMHMLRGKAVISNMVSNVLVGMSSYAVRVLFRGILRS